MIYYLPIIKVIDTKGLNSPHKYTVARREDGQLWWKYTETIPEIKVSLTDVRINSILNGDRYNNYRFSQCLFNLLIFNNLSIDRPQKFIFEHRAGDGALVFIYFLDENEIITVPTMPNFQHSLIFSLFKNNTPILKLETYS